MPKESIKPKSPSTHGTPCLDVPEDWWFQAFPIVPYESKQPGADQMLILVAYDISDPRRLSKVARACEDFGVRVQYSVFECHLDTDGLNRLWLRILEIIDEDTDRVVAYRLDARSARETLTAGRMVCSEEHVCYLV